MAEPESWHSGKHLARYPGTVDACFALGLQWNVK